MQTHFTDATSSLIPAKLGAPQRIALSENELAVCRELSVKTLCRWRQEQFGPVFCKLDARAVYLISEVEVSGRHIPRHSTFICAYQ